MLRRSPSELAWSCGDIGVNNAEDCAMHFIQRRPSGDHDHYGHSVPIGRSGRFAVAAAMLVAASWLGAGDAAARGFGGFGGFGGFHASNQTRWHPTSRGPATTNRRNVTTQHWNNRTSRHGSQFATSHYTAPSASHWRQSTWKPNRQVGTRAGNLVANKASSQPKSSTTPSTNTGGFSVAGGPNRTTMTAPAGQPTRTPPSTNTAPSYPSPGKTVTATNNSETVVTTPGRQPQPPRPGQTTVTYGGQQPRPPSQTPPNYGRTPWHPPVYGRPNPIGGPVLASLPPTGDGNAPPPPPTISNNTPPAGPAGGGGGTPPPSNVATNNSPFVPNEILVRFTGGTAPDAIATFTRDQRLALLGAHQLPLINTVLYQFRITDGRAVPAVLAGLQGDGRIAASQPNYLYALQDAAPPVSLAPSQYAAEKLHLSQAHQLATGTGVLIAVIDTAIDAAHNELSGSVVGAYDAVKTPLVPLKHGTEMTSAIVAHARLAGVAPGARILAVRAFDDAANGGGAATTTRLVDSLQWTSTSGARIVNMSFAGPDDPSVHALITALHQKGIVLVAAAGNAGPGAPPAYPGAYPGVIAVTATDSDDHLLGVANRGSYIAVAAPGVDVMAAAPNGAYDFSTGTSIACAHVSGLAALLIQRNPSLTPDALATALMQTAKHLGPKGRDDEFGAGLVDAYEAVLSQAPAVAQGGAPQNPN
jgi:subtilisin family serine protease